MARTCDIVGLCGPPPENCREDYARVEKECAVDGKAQFQDRLRDRNRRMADRARRKNDRTPPDPYHIRNKTWKDDHCKSALFHLNRRSLNNAADNIENLADEFQDYLEELINDLPAEVAQEIASSVPGRALETAACARMGPFAWACAVITGGYNLYEMGNEAWQAWGDIQGLQDELAQLNDLIEDGIDIGEGLQDPDKMREFRERKLQEMMDSATSDPCLKARTCILTPYRSGATQGRYDTGMAPGTQRPLMDTFGSDPHQLFDPRGCCPGMTGHHLINDAWVKNDCPGYSKNRAPVVCVAGASQNEGQHGEIHTVSDELLARTACNFNLDAAIGIAVASHQRALPQDCDPKCLETQLRQYYAGLCGTNQLTPIDSQRRDLSADCPQMTS